MKSKILLATLSVLVFSACNSETKNTENNNAAMNEQQTQAGTMEHNNPSSSLELDPATPINSSSSKVALNPEHGQPGHRCYISVGAPLNSAPATPQNAAQPMNVAPMVAEQPIDGNVKLNPAHGEPGHRCDIQVGAPLS